MAKEVYQILSSDRPGNQVNGILTDTMEREHEMLKTLVQHQQAEKVSEPRHEKRVFGVSDQVQHKSSCTTTEDG